MTKIILPLVSDEDGKFFLKAAIPTSVYTDKNPPHPIGIKTTFGTDAASGKEAEAWLIVERKAAYRLLQQLSDTLREATEIGAEEITSTITFEKVLNGGAESTTGRMVLLFVGKSGLKYRVLLPRDQSGLLSDFLIQAAQKAGEIADQRVREAAGGIARVEAAPVPAELITIAFDPLTGKEFLNVRLPNGLEYSFELSESQARALRESPVPVVGSASERDRPN